MKVCNFVAAGVAVALLLMTQPVSAGSSKTDRRIAAASIGVGTATTLGYFALRDWKLNNGHTRLNGLGPSGAFAVMTGGCLALSPIVATVLVKRELTFREAYGLAADCVIPFVGAWLVNRAFDAHPEWEPKAKLVRKRR
jgi:hypothetical protein